MDQKTKTIGQSVRKIDAKDKALGKSQFAADLSMEGMLYARVLRSAHAHALVKNVMTQEAKALPGVHAVLTAADVPGKNGYGIIHKDQPVLAGDKVRYYGDAIAIVAADCPATAEQALSLIKVDYEVLPSVHCPVEAMAENAPQVHDNNILLAKRIRKGDVEKALAESPIVVEKTYRTQCVEHCYIEPEAGIAYMDGDTIVIRVSSQNVHYDRKDVALNLGLPLNRVRIIQTVTGGGFGGKLDISVQCHLALLAMAVKKPVKLVYTREESFVASAKRHPVQIKVTTAADAQGTLTAMKAEIICDTGAYASYGSATMGRAMVHATGPYEIPNVHIDAYCVYTNNPVAGAMRGFGVPQVAFAHENQMDLIAAQTGISPFDIRLRNALEPGSLTATGQSLAHSVGIKETIEKARKKAVELQLGKGGR